MEQNSKRRLLKDFSDNDCYKYAAIRRPYKKDYNIEI